LSHLRPAQSVYSSHNWVPRRRANLDPAAEQDSITSDELLVSQPNDKRIKERSPRIVFFPLGIQKPLSNVSDGRSEGKLPFGVKGLVEDHGENGGSCGHDASEHEGDDHLDRSAHASAV
jgi:hypothetical protein